MSALLVLKNVETLYGLIYALRGVSLEISQGKIVTILGANGAGKTTILKTIMGLIENQPEKGSIEFAGRRIDGRQTEEIARRGIACVPAGREVFEELSVAENLAMGAYPRRDRVGIRDDLEMIWRHFPLLRERLNQWAGTLSGGE
ncbi:MAG: ATP-binding cassette domain-containing protein, partial [Deltaproteobacteria bacterium]|nr:ATP-binding cassette domain-containing protein [Deltaproteobacteria bacterium]